MRKALGLAAVLVAASLISVAWAQSRRSPAAPPAFEQATRALLTGKYADVPKLVESLDRNDPAVVALVARALIARGQYQDAEKQLRPAAERAPASDAALELGLLLQLLG